MVPSQRTNSLFIQKRMSSIFKGPFVMYKLGGLLRFVIRQLRVILSLSGRIKGKMSVPLNVYEV